MAFNPLLELTVEEECQDAPRPTPGMVAVLYPEIASIMFVKPGDYISHCTPRFQECKRHDRPINRHDLVDYLHQLARTHGLRLEEREGAIEFK